LKISPDTEEAMLSQTENIQLGLFFALGAFAVVLSIL
jgi:hypothetical protein